MICPHCGYALAPFENDCSRCQRVEQERARSSHFSGHLCCLAGAVSRRLGREHLRHGIQHAAAHCRAAVELGGVLPRLVLVLFHGSAGLALLILGLNVLLGYFNIVILPSGWYVPSALLALVLFGLHCHLACAVINLPGSGGVSPAAFRSSPPCSGRGPLAARAGSARPLCSSSS